MDRAEGDLLFKATPSGVAVSLGGRSLTGNDPAASSLRRIPREVPSQTLVLLYSPLLGYGVQELRERLDPTSAMLLVELDDRLATIQHHEKSVIPNPLPEMAGQAWSVAGAVQIADQLIARYGIRRLLTVNLTGGTRLHTRDYAHLTRLVDDRIRLFWNNRGAQIRLGRRWITNLMRNALLDSLPLAALGKTLSPRVVLVGAGPNLDRHLEELQRSFASRAEAGRCPPEGVSLVALDTALPALAEAGLRPHLVFSMDGQLANAYDLMPWRWEGATLIADITVHPSIARRFPVERRAFFASRFSETVSLLHGPVLEGIPLVAPRGSVAPAALEILTTHLGVRHIVTVGVDFWYHPPRTHAMMTGPDRRMRATMARLLRNDGYEELLNRPGRTATLRDGQDAWCDGVLEDQARQMRQVVMELHQLYPGLEISTPDASGLPTGALLRADALRRVASATVGSIPADPAPKQPEHAAFRLRREALRGILHRLRAQEKHLTGATRADEAEGVFLDADLAFVLLDMPQWPLVVLRQEWARTHARGIARSVRDYRRRLERALRAGVDSNPPANP